MAPQPPPTLQVYHAVTAWLPRKNRRVASSCAVLTSKPAAGKSRRARSNAVSPTTAPSQWVMRPQGEPPPAGQAKAGPVPSHWADVNPWVIQVTVCGRSQRWFMKSMSRTPVQPVAGVPSHWSPYPPHVWLTKNPRPMQELL